jgi:hypothetical protein
VGDRADGCTATPSRTPEANLITYSLAASPRHRLWPPPLAASPYVRVSDSSVRRVPVSPYLRVIFSLLVARRSLLRRWERRLAQAAMARHSSDGSERRRLPSARRFPALPIHRFSSTPYASRLTAQAFDQSNQLNQ